VQQTVPQLVPPGHQLPGWLFPIQPNEFLSGLRPLLIELNEAVISKMSRIRSNRRAT